MKSVCIVLLNWNRSADTLQCLESLRGLDYPNFYPLLVDNGSTDNSVKLIRSRFPDLEIIETGANLGFTKGNNAGIRAALRNGAAYVWLLNNDTTVDKQALRSMIQLAESDPNIGAVGSAIYYADEPDRLQAWGGGWVDLWLGRGYHFDQPVPDERIQFITGASLLVRREVLESVGLMDEGFFLYWEDADYCFRMRRAGWRLAVAGDAKVWHKIGATLGRSSPRVDLIYNQSTVRFVRKHRRVPFLSPWLGVSLRIAKRLLIRDWTGVSAIWRGARAAAPAE